MQTIVDAPVKIQQEKKMRQAVAKVAGKTAADLLRVSADSRHRYELIQGKIITLSLAGYKHGMFAMRLGGRMLLHAETSILDLFLPQKPAFNSPQSQTQCVRRMLPLWAKSAFRRILVSPISPVRQI